MLFELCVCSSSSSFEFFLDLIIFPPLQTPNPAWPPPSLFIPLQPERIKDVPIKNWSPIAGSGPVPWRQAPSVFSGSGFQSELQSKAPFDLDVPGGIDRLRINERLSFTPMEKRKQEESFEKLMNGSLRTGASEIPGNGNAGNHVSINQKACLQLSVYLMALADGILFSRGRYSRATKSLCKQFPADSLSADVGV